MWDYTHTMYATGPVRFLSLTIIIKHKQIVPFLPVTLPYILLELTLVFRNTVPLDR